MNEKKIVYLQVEMTQDEIIQRIKETAQQVLPAGATLWLYGSRARGEANADSDYDLLMLIDGDHVTAAARSAAYDLCLMGYEYGVDIAPHIYPKEKWAGWTYSPFYKNVEQDKIVLI